MREKDNSRIYIKYKDKKRVQKLKQEDILNIPYFEYLEENIEEIIFENCYLDYELYIKAKNADTKVIFRNCAFDKLFVENGKVYLTDVNATYLKGINNKTFALKEKNEIDMDMKIKAGTVFISGDLKETNTEIEAEKLIIDSATISTFFDFIIKVKKLNINQSNFLSSHLLSLDYQKALVAETSLATYIFKVNGRLYKLDDTKISIYNNDPNKEEYVKSYLWLEFLRSLKDKVTAINTKDYKNSCKQISEESMKKIEEYKEEIEKHKLEIQNLQSKINNEGSIKSRNQEEANKVLSKRMIGSIEGVVEEKPQQ